ncbi:Pentatricopeptide repeat [Macleaya cordata]|uniref:Pentatricopeptide repeat n=1 Tax=Macleaya cordata TaxID=56857 RepID=A0A200RB04_MACCD|nr:Pentatricopeptide repeat [Macleaya cordata]
MRCTQTQPDNYTFACILRACTEKTDPFGLRIAHGGVIVSGLELDSVSSSALVSGYSKLGLVDEAYRVFNGIPDPDLVLWNSMVVGYGYGGFWDKCLVLFNGMRKMGRNPDGYTLVGLISGFNDPWLLEIGQGIHGFCLKNGFDSNAHVGSSIVSMYSRCNCLDSAYKAFSSLPNPDLVQWSALITGFSQTGNSEEALVLFKEMNFNGEHPDPILIASVLAASARLAIVRTGREIHSYVFRNGFESDVMVASALIDMYTKCGSAVYGVRVFEIMHERNVVTYNSVISGLGSNGLVSQAFAVFEEMVEKGFKPDQSTFSALLSACSHGGFVNDGKEIFRRMEKEFGITARMEHYVYMVKLLGMAGELQEACNFIQTMQVPPDSGVLGALLSCCVVHGNSELGEIVVGLLSEIDPNKTAYKVMLSNIYAVNGKWDDVKKLRDDMLVAGLRKTPGVSWI